MLFMTPVVAVAARIFASSAAIVGSSVDVWPFLAASVEQVHLLTRR